MKSYLAVSLPTERHTSEEELRILGDFNGQDSGTVKTTSTMFILAGALPSCPHDLVREGMRLAFDVSPTCQD